MTDLEEDGDGISSSALEIICYNYGNNLYKSSISSVEETPREFFESALSEAVKGHRQWTKARHSVYDFAVDSFRYYRRHEEKDYGEAVEMALRDTYSYMMALANDMPPLTRRMHERWWYK
jgi:hypothetical protein